MYRDIINSLPKKIKRTRKRPNASGIDLNYIKKINGKLVKKTCILEGKTKTGKKKVANYIGFLTESITFGKTRSYFTKNPPVIDRIANRLYPEAYKKLKIVAEKEFPDFKYNNICLNHNFQCKPHRDNKNMGFSYIVGFGDYTGGELNVEGKKVDIKEKPFTFNGSEKEHWVEPFKGNRYTAVYFYQELFSKKVNKKQITQ